MKWSTTSDESDFNFCTMLIHLWDNISGNDSSHVTSSFHNSWMNTLPWKVTGVTKPHGSKILAIAFNTPPLVITTLCCPSNLISPICRVSFWRYQTTPKALTTLPMMRSESGNNSINSKVFDIHSLKFIDAFWKILVNSKCLLDWTGTQHHIVCINIITNQLSNWTPELFEVCKNAFSISANITIGWSLRHSKTPLKSGKSTGPRYRHSFRLLTPFLAFTEASYTTLNLVVSFIGVRIGCSVSKYCHWS